jgi:transforming growth factor-beta-induced protein
MRIRFLSTAFMAICIATTSFACDNNSKSARNAQFASNTKNTNNGGVKAAEEINIVGTAVEAGSFTTLVSLLKEADLVSTLEGKGPFTVFAPSDEAFKKVPADVLKSLSKDKTKLAGVLTYHVIAGSAVMAADVVKMDGQKVKTVNGQDLTISVKDGQVMVDNATVVTTDIKCTNGVIHVIDSVVLPK